MRSVARGLLIALIAIITVAGLLSNTSPKADAVQRKTASIQATRAFVMSVVVTHHAIKAKPVVVKPAVVADPMPERHFTAHVYGEGYNVGIPLWQTWNTDPTAYEPSADDPMRILPKSAQYTFACIRYAESRNHPTSVNVSSGAEGLYQFLPYIWKYGANALGIPVSSAIYATPEQQAEVAIWYYKRDGFSPWSSDGCE